jgi:hypothetical protein
MAQQTPKPLKFAMQTIASAQRRQSQAALIGFH